MWEYFAVALSFVGATHSWSICNNCLVTVCEYRMDPEVNYYKSWNPIVIHIPYGEQCPAFVRDKVWVSKN